MLRAVLKKITLSAGLFAALGLAAAPQSKAGDLTLGLSIGGPNGAIYVGSDGSHYDSYDRYYDDYRSYKNYNRSYGRKYYPSDDYANCGGITRMSQVHYSRYCESPRVIYDRLRFEGWHEFTGLRIRPRAFKVLARNVNGVRYKLRVDRCTGEILRAKRKHSSNYSSDYRWRNDRHLK